MNVKDHVKYAKKTMEEAKKLLIETKASVCNRIFHEVIVPTLKEYKFSLKWRMGSVFARAQNDEELEENDPRIKILNDKITEVLDGFDIIENGYSNELWWVLSEHTGDGATNDIQQVVPFDKSYNSSSDPSKYGRKKRFSELERGDFLYKTHYDNGEIIKYVVDEVEKTPAGLKIHVLDPDEGPFIIEADKCRYKDLFTQFSTAERSLDRVWDFLHNHHHYFDYPFRADPDQIMGKVLS